MATLQDKWDAIENDSDYVPSSLILKSYDYRGATFKWLVDVSGVGNRKERFYQITPDSGWIMTLTVVSEIDVVPAQ